eukprot:gene17625-biopygen13693
MRQVPDEAKPLRPFYDHFTAILQPSGGIGAKTITAIYSNFTVILRPFSGVQAHAEQINDAFHVHRRCTHLTLHPRAAGEGAADIERSAAEAYDAMAFCWAACAAPDGRRAVRYAPVAIPYPRSAKRVAEEEASSRRCARRAARCGAAAADAAAVPSPPDLHLIST